MSLKLYKINTTLNHPDCMAGFKKNDDEIFSFFRLDILIRRYTRFNQQAGAIQKLNFDGLQIDLENRSVTTSNGTFELPPKEFDLLLYCAKHQGKILTKQQIYEEVWGEEYFYDDSNIMAIISRLRKKLEVNPSSPNYDHRHEGKRLFLKITDQ